MLITETEFVSGLTAQTYLPSGVTAMGLELEGPVRIGADWAAAGRVYWRTSIPATRSALTVITEACNPTLIADIEVLLSSGDTCCHWLRWPIRKAYCPCGKQNQSVLASRMSIHLSLFNAKSFCAYARISRIAGIQDGLEATQAIRERQRE